MELGPTLNNWTQLGGVSSERQDKFGGWVGDSLKQFTLAESTAGPRHFGII